MCLRFFLTPIHQDTKQAPTYINYSFYIESGKRLNINYFQGWNNTDIIEKNEQCVLPGLTILFSLLNVQCHFWYSQHWNLLNIPNAYWLISNDLRLAQAKPDILFLWPLARKLFFSPQECLNAILRRILSYRILWEHLSRVGKICPFLIIHDKNTSHKPFQDVRV